MLLQIKQHVFDKDEGWTWASRLSAGGIIYKQSRSLSMWKKDRFHEFYSWYENHRGLAKVPKQKPYHNIATFTLWEYGKVKMLDGWTSVLPHERGHNLSKKKQRERVMPASSLSCFICKADIMMFDSFYICLKDRRFEGEIFCYICSQTYNQHCFGLFKKVDLKITFINEIKQKITLKQFEFREKKLDKCSLVTLNDLYQAGKNEESLWPSSDFSAILNTKYLVLCTYLNCFIMTKYDVCYISVSVILEKDQYLVIQINKPQGESAENFISQIRYLIDQIKACQTFALRNFRIHTLKTPSCDYARPSIKLSVQINFTEFHMLTSEDVTNLLTKAQFPHPFEPHFDHIDFQNAWLPGCVCGFCKPPYFCDGNKDCKCNISCYDTDNLIVSIESLL